MVKSRSPVVSRRLLVALLVFGVFVLFDIALFGWLIFRSLSEREVEKILLESRDEMETLADEIALRAHDSEGDLYTAVASSTETLTYIDSVLRERNVVATVEIRDNEGAVIYRLKNDAVMPVGPGGTPNGALGLGDGELTLGDAEVPPTGEESVHQVTRSGEYGLEEIQIPIGEVGIIQVGISRKELQGRIEVLRRDLVGQTATVGGITLLLFFTAYLAIWFLLRRSRRLEEQAAEAERMAYIGTLASGLAHEIRNPLNSLNLNMQLLKEEMGDVSSTPSSPRLLDLTRSEISRLERLVTDFLSYAKPRPLDLETVSPREVLEEVLALVAADAHSRRIRVDLVDETGGALVQLDPEQIRQLLLNLVQNALAATEEVEGRTSQGLAALGRVTLTARSQGRDLLLEVSDDGVGIEPEDRERMFDLFYSTRRGGTGLGLAIVQRIVRDHDGRIVVDSAPGAGTRVTVVLPQAVKAETGAIPRVAESPA